jgi:hypothetical protein
MSSSLAAASKTLIGASKEVDLEVNAEKTIYIITCRGVFVRKITGSRTDDWIY